MAIIKHNIDYQKMFSQVVTFTGDIYRLKMGYKKIEDYITTAEDDVYKGEDDESVIVQDGTEQIEGMDKTFYNKTYVSYAENIGDEIAPDAGTADLLLKTYWNKTMHYPEIIFPTLDKGVKVYSRTFIPIKTEQFKESHRNKNSYDFVPDSLPSNSDSFSSIRKVVSTKNIFTYSI